VGQGSGIAMSCGVGHSRGSDPMLLWLWCGLVAVAVIQLTHAASMALKSKKKKKDFGIGNLIWSSKLP